MILIKNPLDKISRLFFSYIRFILTMNAKSKICIFRVLFTNKEFKQCQQRNQDTVRRVLDTNQNMIRVVLLFINIF